MFTFLFILLLICCSFRLHLAPPTTLIFFSEVKEARFGVSYLLFTLRVDLYILP